jgi:aminopeptidase N
MAQLPKHIFKTILALAMVQFIAQGIKAQPLNKKDVFTHQDTLRGSIGPGRVAWDVLKYDITVQPDYNAKTISGSNTITYMDNGVRLMQIDLQEPMIIDSIIQKQQPVNFTREGNVYWVQLRDTNAMYKIKPGKAILSIYFHGKPKEAVHPPWDGGWIWKKDKKGNPWMSAACQGLGASVWYPCKDTQSDEPDDGAILRIIVPDSLVAIGNGRLTNTQQNKNGTTQFTWEVKNPINNYNIIPYIGKYAHFSEKFKGEKGRLNMDYWVLSYNLDSAKKHFTDAPRMMKAFEHWFGPYPFYEDGYKLVEAPHLGMEHQSAVAYGNNYKKGYLGKDMSGSGWGSKWDFIIIHESGHEWFANNITTKDIADMWVHEGFTNYSETLFTDYYYGKTAGNEYAIGTSKDIANDIPVIGQYGVNKEGSGDMYNKAGSMLHIIRQITGDNKFRDILRGLNKTFYHQTVTTQQIESYISEKSGKDFSKVFDQYLRTIQVPVLEYKLDGNKLDYRYTNCVKGFDLPLKTNLSATDWLRPTESWQTVNLDPGGDHTFTVDPNFFIRVKKVE